MSENEGSARMTDWSAFALLSRANDYLSQHHGEACGCGACYVCAMNHLRATIARLEREREDWLEWKEDWAKANDQLRARVAALVAALRKYGQHTIIPAGQMLCFRAKGIGPCNCGLAAALAGEEGT